MVKSTFHRESDRYVVEVPKDEDDRLGLVDGQQVEMELAPIDAVGIPDDELRQIIDRLVETHLEALDYLVDH